MPMTVRVYRSQNEKENVVLEAFYQGCPEPKELVNGFDYKPSDVAVIMGVYKKRVPISFPRGNVFRRQREKNLDVVVLETGYINRGDGENHHYAAGFNGLNGRADFRNEGHARRPGKTVGGGAKALARRRIHPPLWSGPMGCLRGWVRPSIVAPGDSTKAEELHEERGCIQTSPSCDGTPTSPWIARCPQGRWLRI
jgi:hypothetical protein